MQPHKSDDAPPRRFRLRLSTLMLLIVIVALVAALLIQGSRSARREAQYRALAAELRAMAEQRAAREQALTAFIRTQLVAGAEAGQSLNPDEPPSGSVEP
jgi:hypothetical protein